MNHLAHSDFCGWHEDQRDADCTCGHVSGVDGTRWRHPDPVALTKSYDRPRASEHADNCDWHVDQYDFECTCGAVTHCHRVRPATPGQQSRADSLMESVTNIAIGLAVSQAANLVVLPLVFGVAVSQGQALALGIIYTAISLVRSYAIRRAFNGRSVWQAIKGLAPA